MTSPVLRLSHITKRFGTLVANDDISLELQRGEVLALLGENGAGKSTLVSILFGHYVADAGTVEVDGKALPPGQPRAALAAGIGMVHQHFTLADNLTVLENIVIGTRPLWRAGLGYRAARDKVAALARRFGLDIRPQARVADLSVGERQRVEIIKALYRGARVLILDEPTAVLTPQEAQGLFDTLRQMIAEGLSVVFISHKLDEVLRVSHRIAVLRGGRLVATRPAAQTDKAELAELMVGRAVAMPARQPAAGAMDAMVAEAAVVAELEHVSVHARAGRGAGLRDVSLRLHAGEIVGIAGVAGNGQLALAGLMSGTLGADTGSVRLAGRTMPARPAAWVAAGVARVPEDRHAVGAVGDLAIWENAIIEQLGAPAFSRWGWIRRAAAFRFAADLIQRFDVRGGGIEAPTRALSGGNMQKLILGRALSVRGEAGPPWLVVANQPTWGLDIGAVAYVHGQLLAATEQGAAALLISDDLDELRALSDRIAVMHDGRLTAARPASEWTLAELGMAMAGSAAGGSAHVGEEACDAA
ncbi:ABC transporter ATP-binding protein [Cupriavidus respiraculi]|uniref:ABC transporter ATP-binding protein n=1 Tax=Cupriavidus respiraculi TaxID=195930 RepID=UPI001C966641|nr:ABC transporter ATP-binding protein [Cupriavidus respiraculi]MBY4948240.1 ABC transporter ATP-binding protein [Cupriavidus respiraculi]